MFIRKDAEVVVLTKGSGHFVDPFKLEDEERSERVQPAALPKPLKNNYCQGYPGAVATDKLVPHRLLPEVQTAGFQDRDQRVC